MGEFCDLVLSLPTILCPRAPFTYFRFLLRRPRRFYLFLPHHDSAFFPTTHHHHQQQQLQQQKERWRPSPFDDDPTGLADLRLQIQASKLAFIVSKRSQVLAEAGLTLRREGGTCGGAGAGGGGDGATSTSTIQEFLDRTWAARHVSRRSFNPLPGPTNNVECPPATGYNREGIDAFAISALRVQYGQSRGDRSGGGGDGDDGGGGEARERARDLLGFSSRFEMWQDMTFVSCEELGWVFLHQVTEGAIEAVKALFR